jgi:hypothetical protein
MLDIRDAGAYIFARSLWSGLLKTVCLLAATIAVDAASAFLRGQYSADSR